MIYLQSMFFVVSGRVPWGRAGSNGGCRRCSLRSVKTSATGEVAWRWNRFQIAPSTARPRSPRAISTNFCLSTASTTTSTTTAAVASFSTNQLSCKSELRRTHQSRRRICRIHHQCSLSITFPVSRIVTASAVTTPAIPGHLSLSPSPLLRY